MKPKPGILVLIIVITALISMDSFAQRTTDIENGKDHPLVSRFKGSIMEFYKETKWGTYKLPVNEKGSIDWGNPQILEGKVIRTQYTTAVDNNAEFVLQNYKTAFRNAGFKILISAANEELGVTDRPHTWGDKYYRTGLYGNDGLNNEKFGMGVGLPAWKNNHSFIAAKASKEGKDIYAIIYTVVDNNYTLITQDIIEVEAVETGMVSAENISKGIQTDGHFAVYDILFETGKSDIRPESEAALKNIAEFMKLHPAKKFYIVGHTDNVGNFVENKTLSENRAKAVMNELITKYAIAPDQLSAYGVSSLSPLSSNATTEGKARNRRVEIVEQ